MGAQKRMIIDEHRNEPEIEIFDKEMMQERIRKKELDERMEKAEMIERD